MKEEESSPPAQTPITLLSPSSKTENRRTAEERRKQCQVYYRLHLYTFKKKNVSSSMLVLRICTYPRILRARGVV
jgi:hypothetical protein